MESTIELMLILSFECHRCRGPVRIKQSEIQEFSTDRAFCGNCGAAYVYYGKDAVYTVKRIKFGEMYLPPLEWNQLFQSGMDHGAERGRIAEAYRRRGQSFWRRLGDFVRNR